MKKSEFSEARINGMLGEQEVGAATVEIYRRYEISAQTFYRWKARYGGMTVSDARWLKTLDEENRRQRSLRGNN